MLKENLKNSFANFFKNFFWKEWFGYLFMAIMIFCMISLPMQAYWQRPEYENFPEKIYLLEKKVSHLQEIVRQWESHANTPLQKNSYETEQSTLFNSSDYTYFDSSQHNQIYAYKNFFLKANLLEKKLQLSAEQKIEIENIFGEFARDAKGSKNIWKILAVRENIQEILTFQQNELYLKILRENMEGF